MNGRNVRVMCMGWPVTDMQDAADSDRLTDLNEGRRTIGRGGGAVLLRAMLSFGRNREWMEEESCMGLKPVCFARRKLNGRVEAWP